MFKLVEVKEGENPLYVQPVTEWDYSYVLQCMAVSGDTLIIGDLVRSVALLDIDWNEGKLEKKARDHQDLGPYRLAPSGDKGVIGSNVSSPDQKPHLLGRGSHVTFGRHSTSGIARPRTVLVPGQRYLDFRRGWGVRHPPTCIKIRPGLYLERGRKRNVETHPPVLHELGTRRSRVRTGPFGFPRLDTTAK